ncbi:MAG TPA: hypothetical protein VHZ03_53290 [Trebonia sp.]|jgi:quinol monooxygenase YgiN|nr:hypothetical protein [Trebonia sp.]
MTATQLPETAVVRVSRGNFDPARFDEVQAMTVATGRYLIPAIKELPGLISYYASASPDGSVVHVSIWESGEHAQQMSRLKEMIVDARSDAERAGVTFPTPIINYPIDWAI